MYIYIGDKIKTLRAGINITQAVLAQRLGVTKSMVSAYENGIRFPSYEILLKLADIFGVSTDFLLGYRKNNTIDVSGLTENQIEGIALLIASLKKDSEL